MGITILENGGRQKNVATSDNDPKMQATKCPSAMDNGAKGGIAKKWDIVQASGGIKHSHGICDWRDELQKLALGKKPATQCRSLLVGAFQVR